MSVGVWLCLSGDVCGCVFGAGGGVCLFEIFNWGMPRQPKTVNVDMACFLDLFWVTSE